MAIAGSGAAGNLGTMKNRTDEVERQQLRLDRGLGLGQGVKNLFASLARVWTLI